MADETSIVIPKSVIGAASPAFKAELAQLMGLMDGPQLEGAPPTTGSKLAELDEPTARLFLSGCGAKTKRVLELIIKQDGTFYLRALERSARSTTIGLSGVWTGLTKRTRTMTGDPDATLIGWQRRGDDYEGWLSQKTCQSFKLALGL
jgi:hypothetical protein